MVAVVITDDNSVSDLVGTVSHNTIERTLPHEISLM